MSSSARLEPGLSPDDLRYVSAVGGAQVVEPAPKAMHAVYLLLATVAVALLWAALSRVDIVTKANGRIVPDGREQLIASLEGGILRELHVSEGQTVEEGQVLAELDPTRFEAQQAEGQAKRLALQAAVARLQAEATGRNPAFPPELKARPELVAGETANFEARQRALNEAVGTTQRSIALLNKELTVSEAMAAKGLMSEVEVMRVRRQINDLNLQVQERINRFRQEASAELVRTRTELQLLEEQMVVRDDALKRTVLTSPIRGVVKQIKANTAGGVVAPGAPVMEILPLAERVLVEARVRPADIGFVKVGQAVTVKLSAYDYTIYGGLKGQVVSISPDALGDPDRAATPDGTYYRAIVEAGRAVPKAGGKPLPVMPGMTGSVEIRTGERSVLGFLLRPMLKSREAFRER